MLSAAVSSVDSCLFLGKKINEPAFGVKHTNVLLFWLFLKFPSCTENKQNKKKKLLDLLAYLFVMLLLPKARPWLTYHHLF